MATGSTAQTRRVTFAGALLHLLAFFADGGLQGVTDTVAVSAVLRRFTRSSFRHDVCCFSPAVFDQHTAVVASGAAVPVRGAQRRNQHDCFQSPLAPR